MIQMKMSADYACGQLLFNLKNSNLHYLIKETHLSAYITIRKKLINPSSDILISDANNVNVDIDENVVRTVKKENDALKVEINNLKTTAAIMRVELEELELKNESLHKDIATHDDKMLEVYSEGRTSLSKSNSEKSKLIQTLKDKDIEILNIKKEQEKTKNKCKVLENVKNEMEENVMMLENKLASRDQQVYKLKEEMKTLEDTVPITFSTSCDKCEKVTSTEKNLKEHDEVDHSDENLPSSSKCGKCEFDSGDEEDLNHHIESKHVISCDMCEFKTDSNTEAENHILFNHAFACENCKLTFKNQRKLSEHMCRIPILNPTCGDAYMKNWIIFDGCTRIFSTKGVV